MRHLIYLNRRFGLEPLVILPANPGFHIGSGIGQRPHIAFVADADLPDFIRQRAEAHHLNFIARREVEDRARAMAHLQSHAPLPDIDLDALEDLGVDL